MTSTNPMFQECILNHKYMLNMQHTGPIPQKHEIETIILPQSHFPTSQSISILHKPHLFCFRSMETGGSM